MTRREIEARYKGSLGGLLWYVFNSLALLAIYSFVFGVIFKARWQAVGIDGPSIDGGFAMPLFVGLIVFNVFAETVGRAPSLIVGNVNYVKKVVFPLDILPLITLGAALFNAIMATLVLVVLGFVLGTPVTWKIIYLPFALVPIALLSLGAAWLLASLGVFVRDTGQLVALGVTILMFASPIFYPPNVLPARWRNVLEFNPLSQPIEQARAAVIFDRTPDFTALAGVTALGLVVAWLGWLWFQKTRKGFADVL